MQRILVLGVSTLLLAGCSTYAADRYAISADNVVALREFESHKINVGPFSSTEPGKKEIKCRAVGPIKTPDGEPFSEFVRKALVDELKLAEVYSSDGAVTLTGNLNAVDFSSTDGIWNLSLTVASTNGKSMTVSEAYDYTSSFVGETACNQTAQAFVPAVQNLIGKLVRADGFKELLQ